MQTLTYGFKKPVDGDSADTWMTALEDNVTRVDGHSHNGVDSPLLDATAIAKFETTVAHASWSSQGGGMYRQTITVPAAVLEFDDYDIFIFDTSTKERIFTTVTRVSATTYYIYVNDNSLDLTVKYG